ncbi:hypothetical protein C2E23DRAFT_784803 [Lenzites betulinus]|nr:hypothetical protein C2E23DRAFT_784803 [Lenzites betulinus]
MKYYCPLPYQYAVMRMDPVSMVEHFNDPIATEQARALETKKYLVYLDTCPDLPFPTYAWHAYHVSLISNTLRAVVPDWGITPDMVVPIYPNTQGPADREPVEPNPPFPFHNCFHWLDSETDVRIRRKAGDYDDCNAVRITPEQHLDLLKAFSPDFKRIRDFVGADGSSDAGSTQLDASTNDIAASSNDCAAHLSSTKADSASHSSRHQSSDGVQPPLGDVGQECDGSLQPCESAHNSAQSLENLLSMDVFGLGHKPGHEILPLVDVWFELADHLTADTIPNPLDWDEEQDAIVRIIRDARSRSPLTPTPRRDDLDDDGLGILEDKVSEYSARLDGPFPIQPEAEAESHNSAASQDLTPSSAPSPARNTVVVSQASSTVTRRILLHQRVYAKFKPAGILACIPWAARPPCLPFWP